MSSEKTIAIVVPDASERSSLHELLDAEGFPVEAFSRTEGFVHGNGSSPHGCLIVDLDHSGDDTHQQSLVNFATRWSRELPTIVIASDSSRLPEDPLLPTTPKSAGETKLLYLVYGALSEPRAANDNPTIQC